MKRFFFFLTTLAVFLLSCMTGCNRTSISGDETVFLEIADYDVLSFSKEDFMILFEAYKRMNVSKVGSKTIIGCSSAKDVKISEDLYNLIIRMIDSRESIIVKSGPTGGARLASALSHLSTCSYTEQQLNDYFDTSYGGGDIPMADIYDIISLFCGFPNSVSGDFSCIDTLNLSCYNCIFFFIDDSSSVNVANFLNVDIDGNVAYYDYYHCRPGFTHTSELYSLYYYSFD